MERTIRLARRGFLAVVMCALTVAGAAAQDPRGAITGRISDVSGGRLPGVTVTATNVATNVGSTTATNADFGKVTSQNNLPRDIQLAFKLVF
jgi:hypothetical protein